MKLLPVSPLKRVFLVSLLLIAIFLRFYNLEGSLQFQGDQGRDAMIVADIFRKHDLVFIGPVTSVGNMYLGPLYYYFMLPFLWLTYPNPIGPVYAMAGLGVLTVYLIYFLGKKMIGENGALLASAFYTFSATATQFTRFSWNPNPAPVISLLMIYFTYSAWKKNPWHWVWVSVCFSVLIQLHYLTLLTLPVAGIFWLLSFKDFWQKHQQNKKHSFKPLLKPTFLAISIFLISLTPLILFDLKHGSKNISAFQNLITNEDNFTYSPKVSLTTKLAKTFKETEGRGMHILFEVMIGKNRTLNKNLLYGFAVLICGYLIRQSQLLKKDHGAKYLAPFMVILTYLLIGIIGTAFYEHTIFDHYIAYLFPVTVLVYGWLASSIKPKFFIYLGTIIFAGYFLQYNLPKMPLKTMGWTINDMKRTSEEILKHVQPGEKYNLVLLSESHDIDGQNYRYYLTTGHTSPTTFAERDSTTTLFIINEEKKTTNVTDSPIYEIAVFPDKKPADFFVIPGGPEITMLKRTTQESAQPLE